MTCFRVDLVVVSFHSVEFTILPTRNQTYTPNAQAALAE
jgi:hypothetical protein